MAKAGHGRQANLSWLPGENGQVPFNAVQADPGLYIVRARTGGDVTPGKAKVGHHTGFFSYAGREENIPRYEVLCDTGLKIFGNEFYWQHMGNGAVPYNGVVGGHTASYEPLFIGRARIHGEMCVGKISPAHKCGFMPYGGQEHKVYKYEVLCYKD